MEYNLGGNQKVYMELTNETHGGEGWDFGEVLWSPEANSIGGDSWKIMRSVKAGDIIIHSLKKAGGHQITGMSIVRHEFNVITEEPPIPGRWEGRENYYRIPLQSFSKFNKALSMSNFLSIYKSKLVKLGHTSSFYEKNAEKPAQKYLSEIPYDVFKLLLDYFKTNGEKPFSNIAVKNEDDINTGVDVPPSKTETTIQRIIRNTKIIKRLKEDNDNICQVCGKKIILPNGTCYSEGHHLQKLGYGHNGPDKPANVIILCPFHHTEFDYGIIAIDPNTKKIIHIDKKNKYHGKNLAYQRVDIDESYLRYHLKNIFNK